MRWTGLALAAALASAIGAASPAAAADKADALAVARHYDAAFNLADVKTMASYCADDVAIIDDFPPHIWQGATACPDWFGALIAYDKTQGIAHERVTFQKPLHVDVAGDRAYIVVPSVYHYVLNSKATVATGDWTFAMRKVAVGWRITAWSWAAH